MAAVALGILLLCDALCAQQPVPQASMSNLQDVFTLVRDKLWESNDNYWHRGWFDRCIGNMRIITQIDPRDTEAYIGAAWLMDSDLRQEDAEEFLREGLANNPDVPDMYQELGTFLYLRMRFDESIVYLSGAVMTDAPPYVWHQLAHAYERAGRIGDSLDTWFLLEAMEPDNGVPPMQIDRILHGGEPSRAPENVVESIARRKKERQAEQHQTGSPEQQEQQPHPEPDEESNDRYRPLISSPRSVIRACSLRFHTFATGYTFSV